jgi:hypothetical protein
MHARTYARMRTRMCLVSRAAANHKDRDVMFVDSHVCHVIVCNPREPRPLCVCVCFVCVCVCVCARSCVLCAALGLRTVNESGKMREIAHSHKDLDYDASFLLEFSHGTLLPRLTHFQVSALHKTAHRDIRIAMRSSCFGYQRSHASAY